MLYFDAHADTVLRSYDSGLDFVAGKGRAHIDLPRAKKVNLCTQVFVINAVRSQYPDKDLDALAQDGIGRICSWIEHSAGDMQLALTKHDIQMAFAEQSPGNDQQGIVPSHERKLFVLLGLEGADPLLGQAQNLKKFHQLGVRNIIPAWDDNGFSGSSSGSGTGLTEEGQKLVGLCQELHMMLDVSHLSDTAFWQIMEISRQPFIASHSNCRALTNTHRNLSDEMIRSMAEKGGVMGINLYPGFLSQDYTDAWDAIANPALEAAKTANEEEKNRLRLSAIQQIRAIPLPGMEWVGKHAAHAVQVGGEDCVGLGGDLDGITVMPAGFTGIESYPLIIESLRSAGLNSNQIEKICWKNMARVFEDVLASN